MNFITLQVDLGGVTTQMDIARSIARKLRSQVAEKDYLKEKAKEVWQFLQKWEAFGVWYKGDTSNNIEDVLDELVDTIATTARSLSEHISGIFIVIDEADAPPETAGLGEFVKLFTERLTRKDCNNVLLGLSGLPSLIGKLKASHESSARIFEILHLDPLEHNERRQVIERGLEEAKQKNNQTVSIDEDAMLFLCELSEGYPHFIQQFAFSAFAEDQDNRISLDDVISGAYKDNGALAQLGKKYFSEMYYERVSSPDYRKVLDAMSEHEDNWVVRKTLVKESGVKETTLNNALNALKAKKVILTDESRQGYYRLPTRSFAAWISANRAVELKSFG